MFGGCGALLIILCIAFLFAIVIIVIKKDNDLLKYVDSVKEQLQDCATSTSEIPEDSPIPPPSSGEVEVAAGSEPPASGQGREQTVEENHGTPRSSRRQRRLLGKGGYKNHPVYKPMKRVLVGAHLSDRKHQMVLKHIRKECETCAP